MTLIKSDAVTGEFSKGKFLKLSERPPEFREKFQSARKVSVWSLLFNTAIFKPLFIGLGGWVVAP